LSRARTRNALAAATLLAFGSGCWEQVSRDWFSQMKEQPAVQALEGPGAPLVPPDLTIPVGGLEPRIDFPAPAFHPAAQQLVNPVARTPESLARGEFLYGVYCSVCHGKDGMSNQAQLPVARRLSESGMPPIPLMAVPAYSDGFLFTKIRYGKPGMPAYPQIAPEDRWHIVNYLRTLIEAPTS
jgi:mono/diheme cytochrome c family protein